MSLNTGRLAERANELERERDPQNLAISTPRFARNFSTWNSPSQAEGYPQNCMVELPRNQVSELHFDEIPDPPAFQCWKTKFKTEVCSSSGCPTDILFWIKEVEVATSVDDLMTSQSMRGYRFRNFDKHDAKTASAFEKSHLKSVVQKMRISVEEQNAQTQDRFLRDRQIANTIYELSRVTALDLTDLFSVSFPGDDIQDFDI